MIDLQLLEVESEVKLRYNRLMEAMKEQKYRSIANLKIIDWQRAIRLLRELQLNYPGASIPHMALSNNPAICKAYDNVWREITRLNLNWELWNTKNSTTTPMFGSPTYCDGIDATINLLVEIETEIIHNYEFRITELNLNRARDLMLISCTNRLQNL